MVQLSKVMTMERKSSQRERVESRGYWTKLENGMVSLHNRS